MLHPPKDILLISHPNSGLTRPNHLIIAQLSILYHRWFLLYIPKLSRLHGIRLLPPNSSTYPVISLLLRRPFLDLPLSLHSKRLTNLFRPAMIMHYLSSFPIFHSPPTSSLQLLRRQDWTAFHQR